MGCHRVCPTCIDSYMNLLGKITQRFEVGCHLYADDTQLYISLPSCSREAVDVLDCYLEVVGVWMRLIG